MKLKIAIAKENYDLDDLYGEVSQVYEKYDEGHINRDEAVAILLLSCRQFLVSNHNNVAPPRGVSYRDFLGSSRG